MMSAPAPGYRRQRLLVEPAYQWRITRMLVIALLAVVIITLLLVYYALWSTLGTLQVWPTTVFAALFKAVAWMVVVELVLIIPFVVLAGMIMTNQVVGPLARIKAALDQIGQGNYDVRLKLRENDVLIDLADSINRLVAKLQESK